MLTYRRSVVEKREDEAGLGGAVATALAELMPERVAGLVLLAPAGFGRIHLAEAVSLPGVRHVVQATLRSRCPAEPWLLPPIR